MASLRRLIRVPAFVWGVLRLGPPLALVVVGLVWTLGGIVSGCGPDYPPTAWGLYMGRCSRCHEADGSSAPASRMAHARVDLREPSFQRSVDDAELRDIIEHGKGRMQGVAGLSAAELDSIVLYVRRLGNVASSDTLHPSLDSPTRHP